MRETPQDLKNQRRWILPKLLECKNAINKGTIRLDFKKILKFKEIKKKEIHQRLNVAELKMKLKKELKAFYDWLVGFTDGDGCFYFAATKNGGWAFSFQIAQSSYNLRALYYIKTNLGRGQVEIANKEMAIYRLRRLQDLKDFILPIFEEYPLLTNKYFDFLLFKEALIVYTDNNLPLEQKNQILLNLKKEKAEKDKTKISPPLLAIQNETELLLNRKNWIIGFIEAEASFYLVKKGAQRIAHAFEITQKSEEILLQKIAAIFSMNFVRKKDI
jgi:hypothetical protein